MSGGRPTNLDRQNAIALGFKTYTGSPHAACGTTERYIGGGCAHCARTLATEQREARKFLKAQAVAADRIASLEAGAEEEPDEPLDTTEDDGLGNEPSEADRFHQSIEDIL